MESIGLTFGHKRAGVLEKNKGKRYYLGNGGGLEYIEGSRGLDVLWMLTNMEYYWAILINVYLQN